MAYMSEVALHASNAQSVADPNCGAMEFVAGGRMQLDHTCEGEAYGCVRQPMGEAGPWGWHLVGLMHTVASADVEVAHTGEGETYCCARQQVEEVDPWGRNCVGLRCTVALADVEVADGAAFARLVAFHV